MKALTIISASLLSLAVFAAPMKPHSPARMPKAPVHALHAAPVHARHHRVNHHHYPAGAFIAGLSVGTLASILWPEPLPPQPVVVSTTPVVVSQRIWVPPVYETRPVLDAYGRVIRYETVLVRLGYWQ